MVVEQRMAPALGRQPGKPEVEPQHQAMRLEQVRGRLPTLVAVTAGEEVVPRHLHGEHPRLAQAVPVTGATLLVQAVWTHRRPVETLERQHLERSMHQLLEELSPHLHQAQ